MTFWTLNETDIDRIAIGVGILGTGGGGSPYLQLLIAKALLRQGKRWWYSAAPGMAVFILALAFSVLGDALRDRAGGRRDGSA